jgi:predicted N-acetyltransferase YhbS
MAAVSRFFTILLKIFYLDYVLIIYDYEENSIYLIVRIIVMPHNIIRNLSYIIINNGDISPDTDRKIREGLAESFPKDAAHYSRDRVWHSEPAWVALALTNDNRIAAHIAVVERTVTVVKPGIAVKIAGPGGVFVRPQWRKTGLSDHIMKHTLEEAKKRGCDGGLLFCKEVLADKVYSRMGWQKVTDTTFMEDTDGRKVPRPDKDITMSIPLIIDMFPAGDIDLNGPDW